MQDVLFRSYQRALNNTYFAAAVFHIEKTDANCYVSFISLLRNPTAAGGGFCVVAGGVYHLRRRG